MNKSTKISLLVGGIVVVLIGVIGITFAFFSTGGIQNTANTFQSGCLNISLTDASSSISLDKVLPVTDVEGLEGRSYDFTITNTCNTSANYEINLESLNEQTNSLNADYVKVSLSSDTVDNVISILSDNPSIAPTISNAYEAYTLYTGTLNADEAKTYHLKLWLDYDATVNVAANKVYQSKINVVANPEIQVVDNLEAQFTLDGVTLTSAITDNVTSATYCVTDNNICTPITSATINDNSYTVELKSNPDKQMICTLLNGISKIICSDAKKISALDIILADNPTIDNSRSGSITGPLTENTTGTLFTAEDDDGTSYFYAGDVDNNWVSFAGFYWRIIRINGDGSIRMIYSGDSNSGPVETGEATQIGTSAFNEQYDDNAYIGYMYGTPGSDTYEETHANINDSTIKTILDEWYQQNLLSYADKIDGNAGFCADRSINDTNEVWASWDTKLGYATNDTAYGSYGKVYRLGEWLNKQDPQLKCNQTNDLFTIKDSIKGNKKLSNPIGLITMDEIIFAGGFGGLSNASSYLNNDLHYWVITPHYFTKAGYVRMYCFSSYGAINTATSSDTLGVRPVINLKADVTISSGNGTAEIPYTVSN